MNFYGMVDRVFSLKLGGWWLPAYAMVACLGVASCSNAEQPAARAAKPKFPVIIAARRDAQQPLAGVKILAGTKVLGTTDAAGTVRLTLTGAEGDTAALTVKCPEGYTSPERPVVVGLRQMAAGSPAPKFQVDCMATAHTLVIGLRAENGPGLPIVRLDQVIGHTDSLGIAHVAVEASPNEQVTLTLSTDGQPNLRPQNPTLTFTARDRDELVLLEQKFTVLKPKVRAVKRNVPQPL